MGSAFFMWVVTVAYILATAECLCRRPIIWPRVLYNVAAAVLTFAVIWGTVKGK
jgi:hypothetical protein